MRVSYPLKNIEDYNAQGYAGYRNRYGKYPIGAQNTWHGGIHLEERMKALQSIADGRIIAYRFISKNIKVEADNGEHEYSNGFVLIQHDYKSEKEQEMTFYSLYHHLMSEAEIEGNYNPSIPNFLSKTTNVVASEEGILGLNARVLKNRKIDTSKDGVSVVIPKGETITLDPNEDKKGNYKRIIYTDKDGKTHTDIYIYFSTRKAKKIADNTYEITAFEDEDKSVLGARVRAEKKSSSKIVKIIPKDDAVEIDDTEKGIWRKLKDDSGYVHKSSITIKKIFDTEKAKKDEIVACDIPVKAGEIIGYVGDFGSVSDKNYKASHLEVFATDDVADFLKNAKNDGEDEKHYTTIEENTTLKTNLIFDIDLKKATPIKILDTKDEYVKIEIGKISAVLDNETDLDYSNKTYTIKPDRFNAVNKKYFNNLLDTSAKFKPTKNVVREHKDKKWDEDTGRIVTHYFSDSGKSYWIEKSALPLSQEEKKKKSLMDFFQENTTVKIDNTFVATRRYYPIISNDDTLAELEEEITKEDLIHNLLEGKSIRAGNKVLLVKNVSKAYVEPPKNTKNEEVTVEKEVLIDLREFRKLKDNKNILWHKIKCSYTKGYSKQTREGWIKDEDLTKFTAYNWGEFGFKALDAGSDYIYTVKDIMDATDSAGFVKEIWGIIDEDGDKILTQTELKRAFGDFRKSKQISHLVCKHKNEWSYPFSEIKTEIKELFDYGINQEKDSEKKQDLETIRDKRLEELKTKVENLAWWQEASSLAYTDTSEETTETEEEKPPRKFPSTDVVWHFNPIAWIGQMMKMYHKPDIDLRPLMTFESQNPKSTDCNLISKRIMKGINVIAEGAGIPSKEYPLIIDGRHKRFESYYQLADENQQRNKLIFRDNERVTEAYLYLDKALEFGHPVLIGVHHTFNKKYSGKYINETTTDHYVVLVGRKFVNGEQRYVFWDVGTSRGSSTEWYFTQQEDGKLIAEKTFKANNKSFTVTQIRRNKDLNGTYINY